MNQDLVKRAEILFNELEATDANNTIITMTGSLLNDLNQAYKESQILLHPQLRNSRFDFNARYIRFDEAEQVAEFQQITMALKKDDNTPRNKNKTITTQNNQHNTPQHMKQI